MKILGCSPDGRHAVEVEAEAGVITQVSRLSTASGPRDLPVLAPGLVDAQVNGYAGHDVNGEDVEPGTIIAITHALARAGTTSWVPTIITGPRERIMHALDCVRRARDADPVVRAAIPCAHVEGPFISPDDGARGVHDPRHIRPIDADEVTAWKSAGPVGIVTVSGAGAEAPAHIRRIRQLGIAVSIGHTSAASAEISRAVAAGAHLATHLGNGIPTMVPRHPNPMWTLLADDRVRVGLIADGHHLPAETLIAMIRAKQPRGAYLVSDLTAVGGCSPGRYTTAVGGEVELSDNLRLSHLGSDMLAGAAATLLDGVRFLTRATPFTLTEALDLASRLPALATPGSRRALGRIRPGAPADVLLLDPDTVQVETVIVGGNHR
ncbi:N-acetylglucosamine-6-phosphate deacetylase [Myceligenerans pegani]|uniref:Amidohydrolase family protein n=1 Tax=Myceligenerans pegani TaxID=2776917 RepID=A0ABR9MYU3_9MICO|nr:amidohydrolase family protein [Myceligenerans sp. TRM 65318]MBE1876575.1 amidohydrolase family protein [Myceligenerans sp. TRM 65318]MBE3018846.1 amidohydrolase family protein [Myceligenerans sp. TRM 65318]